MMSDKTTYQAIFYGPNVIAAGTPRELEYVNGQYQQEIVIEMTEEGKTAHRRFRIGHENEEPIPYRFVEEESDEPQGEGDVGAVPN
jgi:ribose 1,5-bisphosphokinase PhnN